MFNRLNRTNDILKEKIIDPKEENSFMNRLQNLLYLSVKKMTDDLAKRLRSSGDLKCFMPEDFSDPPPPRIRA